MRELRGLLMDGARLAAVQYCREKTGAWAAAQWSDAQRLAALRRAKDLLDLADSLCEQYRDGTLKQADLKRELRAGAPGFGDDAYALAFELGMRDSL
jgi:hypothetical protein